MNPTKCRSVSQLADLSGRFAIVTGGAGHIGLAIAEAFAESGARILLVDRDAKALESIAAVLSEKHNVDCAWRAVDLEFAEERTEFIQNISNQYPNVDILVNNAAFVGDSTLEGWAVPFASQKLEAWQRALEVNLTAPFDLVQGLAPKLVESGYGSVINIGSIYGILGPHLALYEGTHMGNPAAYAASKGGVVQLTRWLATTLAPKVRVNCLSPGGVARNQDSAFVDRYVERTPLARMGCEEDFKGAALFLASDMSAWVTGQNLIVDGGWSAW